MALNTLSEKYELIRPAVRIKRVLLEKMLDGAASDIKSSSDNVAHAENALWLMKLVHDFLFTDTGNDSDAWSDKVCRTYTINSLLYSSTIQSMVLLK